MKKLDYLEQKITAAIAETHPYTLGEVQMVYRRCNSFDTTINILQQSTASARSIKYTLECFGF